jgi:RNA exonuclease 1
MANATATLEDAQERLCQLLRSDSIIVGHALENDLRALHLVHRKVIDTAYL